MTDQKINPSVPPTSVVKQQELMERLLAADGPDLDQEQVDRQGNDIPKSVPTATVSNSTKVEAVLDLLAETTREPIFSINFCIEALSVNDYSIAIVVNERISLVPREVMQCNLRVGNTNYPVRYVGGMFDFPQLGIRGISFVRDLGR